MGLQAALDEFRNFESTLESMSMKIGGVEKIVATSIVNKLINPYLPDVNIIIEGFTLDMNLGFIAMLDINKEYIVHVFKSQIDAATSRHLKSTNCIYNSIKNGSL